VLLKNLLGKNTRQKRFIANDNPPPNAQRQPLESSRNPHIASSNNRSNGRFDNNNDDDDSTSFRSTNPRVRENNNNNNNNARQLPAKPKAPEGNLIDFLDMDIMPSTPQQQPTHQYQQQQQQQPQFDMFTQQQQQQTPMSPSDVFGGFSSAASESNFPTSAPPPVPVKQQVIFSKIIAFFSS